MIPSTLWESSKISPLTTTLVAHEGDALVYLETPQARGNVYNAQYITGIYVHIISSL